MTRRHGKRVGFQGFEGLEYMVRAQVAEQQGRYLAKELNEQARARSPRVPAVAFKYHHLGSMASLGARLRCCCYEGQGEVGFPRDTMMSLQAPLSVHPAYTWSLLAQAACVPAVAAL